jgi:ribosomal-protein-alanine N-acetyltransferase
MSEILKLTTERLSLRELNLNDALFILKLFNDPAFIQNIGDRGFRTEEDAIRYLREGPIQSLKTNGFALFGVERKEISGLIGICGIVKRAGLDGLDLGFAFLPEFCLQGFATESCLAVLSFARSKLDLKRMLAITNPENSVSIRVVQKLGLRVGSSVQLKPDAPAVNLFEVWL